MTQEIKCLSSDLKICGSILFHYSTSGYPRVPQIAKWMSRHIIFCTFYKPMYANVKVTVCASWGQEIFETLWMSSEAGSDGGLSYVIIWKSTSHSPALSCLFLALPFQFSTKSLQSLCELVPQLSCQTLLISSSNPAQPCICVKWVSFCTLIDPLLWESVAAPRHPSSLGCVGALLFSCYARFCSFLCPHKDFSFSSTSRLFLLSFVFSYWAFYLSDIYPSKQQTIWADVLKYFCSYP